MSKWIDADALIKSICHTADLGGWIGDTLLQIKRLAIRYIDAAPTIDLVHCRECRHNPKYTGNYMYGVCPYCIGDDYYAGDPEDDNYCGYGERKE